jgi:hypothetical protein
MKWSVGAVVLLVIFGGLLADCLAFLVFGWRLPGTFRRPVGARLKAWAGICLAIVGILAAFLLAGNFLSNNSSAKTRWLPLFDVPMLILIVVALVLLWRVGRMPVRGVGGQSMPGDGPPVGRHAANYGGRRSDSGDQPEQGAERFWDSGDS